VRDAEGARESREVVAAGNRDGVLEDSGESLGEIRGLGAREPRRDRREERDGKVARSSLETAAANVRALDQMREEEERTLGTVEIGRLRDRGGGERGGGGLKSDHGDGRIARGFVGDPRTGGARPGFARARSTRTWRSSSAAASTSETSSLESR